MPTELRMPKLGLTMTEGTIVAWQVEAGTAVAAGRPVLVVSTDKVETELEAPVDGILEPIAATGETLPCGALLARLITAEHLTWNQPATAGPGQRDGRRPISPNARRVAREFGVDLATVDGTGPGGRITSEDVERIHAITGPVSAASEPDPAAPEADPVAAAAGRATQPVGDRGSFSHMAAATAARLGLDIAAVPGTGHAGCVTRDDVYAHARRLLQNTEPRAKPEPAPAPAVKAAEAGLETVVPFTGMRKVIAERMHASLTDMAQLTIGMDVAFDRAVALRAELQEAGAEFRPPVPTYTDFVVAAVARALPDHPRLNSRLTDAGIELSSAVNVGITVALDDGLVVPVVHDADRLGLFDLSARSQALVESARRGTLALTDVEGATFCVTSLGMFGVDFFTPVVNPPNAAILGVGRLRTVTLWRDGRPEPGRVVTLSLTWDHRMLDGAPAARFLQRVAHLLEHPAVLTSS